MRRAIPAWMTDIALQKVKYKAATQTPYITKQRFCLLIVHNTKKPPRRMSGGPPPSEETGGSRRGVRQPPLQG